MKLVLVLSIIFLADIARAFADSSTNGTLKRVKRNSCMQNCNSYRCNCPPAGREPLCKLVNVHNKWVVDAANCVSQCVHQSNLNSGGYCKQDTCFCTKRETLKPSKALCEWIIVNGKKVINAANCVSHCVHLSPDHSGGYCNQDSCFCQKREIIVKPPKALCEWVKVNGKLVIDAANCVSHCVHLSSENSGGYCHQESCLCQKREILKPSKALCEWVKVNGKLVINAANCVSHCVHLSSDNSGGYCKQDTCFCEKAFKQPLCQVIKVNNKWITDASGCANNCRLIYKGMKNYGYCQGNNCFCK